MKELILHSSWGILYIDPITCLVKSAILNESEDLNYLIDVIGIDPIETRKVFGKIPIGEFDILSFKLMMKDGDTIPAEECHVAELLENIKEGSVQIDGIS